jgi:trehalose 6-phosphate synthase/phosphatase
LLLDYDGTLVPFASRPQDAVPPAPLVELVARLAGRPEQQVALVSGRGAESLEAWFGGIEGLWIAAEHGALLRTASSREWEPLHGSEPAVWKSHLLPVFEHFVDRTPGSFVEEKTYSLVWHYRMAEPEFGEWLANELLSTLAGLVAETDLHALRGHKSLEIRPSWASKPEVLKRLERSLPEPTFRLALGDDQSDEDLFDHLPADAWTVRVGPGPSIARYRLADPGAVGRLLQSLAEADEPG